MMDMNKPYPYRNCSSLFGYSASVHARSGGICALCKGGGGRLEFDYWRQLTVEHLVGQSQGGSMKDIKALVSEFFPDLDVEEAREFAGQVDDRNTVTACHFCNATTSRMQSPQSMREIIESAGGDRDTTLKNVGDACKQVLRHKKESVKWKLKSVRQAFDRDVKPDLESRRSIISGCTT